jgi:CheY-like chemotaxis protein
VNRTLKFRIAGDDEVRRKKWLGLRGNPCAENGTPVPRFAQALFPAAGFAAACRDGECPPRGAPRPAGGPPPPPPVRGRGRWSSGLPATWVDECDEDVARRRCSTCTRHDIPRYPWLTMGRPGFAYRLLVVDDDPRLLHASRLILEEKGYEVRTAEDGFQALVELRRSSPDLIVSDLKMPNMSGFELLSVVRRRFPHIPVVAISGEYDGTPTALIADAFFSKGKYSPEELFIKIAELIAQSPLRPSTAKPDRAPVWIPRSNTGYLVITCTDCLRSFSVPDEASTRRSELCSTTCTFCGTAVRYLADIHSTAQEPKSGIHLA